MTIPSLDCFELAVVEWEDATAQSAAQFDSPQAVLNAYSPCIRRTVGFWAGATKEVVVLCTDDDRTAANSELIAGPMYIPRSLVRKITPITKTEITVE